MDLNFPRVTRNFLSVINTVLTSLGKVLSYISRQQKAGWRVGTIDIVTYLQVYISIVSRAHYKQEETIK